MLGRRCCRDNYRNRSRATNDTRAENHVLPRMYLWGEKKREKERRTRRKSYRTDHSKQEVIERLFRREKHSLETWKLWGAKDSRFCEFFFPKKRKKNNIRKEVKLSIKIYRVLSPFLPFGSTLINFRTRLPYENIQSRGSNYNSTNSRHRKLIFNRDPTQQLTRYHRVANMRPKLNRGNPTPNLHLIIDPIRKFLFLARRSNEKENSLRTHARTEYLILAFARRRTDKDIRSLDANTAIAVRQTEKGKKEKRRRRRKRKKGKEKTRLAEGRINRRKALNHSPSSLHRE